MTTQLLTLDNFHEYQHASVDHLYRNKKCGLFLDMGLGKTATSLTIISDFLDDLFIERLSPEDRYFYLFLLTNPLCTECGIYEISLSKICSYTGYNLEAVKSIIQRFVLSKKIVYNEATY